MNYTDRDLDHHAELFHKMRVMKEFGEVAARNIFNIEKIELEVYEKQLSPERTEECGLGVETEEFIVVTYVGGAIGVDGANMNSNSANLQVAASRLNSGNYDLDYYHSIVNDPTYKKLVKEE